MFEHGGVLVVLAPHSRRPSAAKLGAGVSEALRASGVAFRIGLSEPFEILSQSPQAYGEARDALQVGRSLDPQKPFHLSRDTAALGFFVRSLQAGRPFQVARIRQLPEHARLQKSDQVPTIEAFLANNGNAVIAAYRLERIGAILGCTLTPEICLDLRLELIAYRVQQGIRV